MLQGLCEDKKWQFGAGTKEQERFLFSYKLLEKSQACSFGPSSLQILLSSNWIFSSEYFAQMNSLDTKGAQVN